MRSYEDLGMNSWLYRFAVFTVILAMVVIVAGALLTSTNVAARQSQSIVSPVVDVTLHRALAIALTLFSLVLAIWTSRIQTPGWLRAVTWLSVVTLALCAALGWAPAPLPVNAGVLHALLAHLCFSLIVATAIGASTGWNLPPELVDGSSKPLLRPLAIATPPIVFLQIALGAAYRHDMTGIMPHMTVAMGVAFMALIGSSVVLQNFPGPASLRRAAAALISLVLAQICLGIAAFLMLLLNFAGTFYFVAITIGHVLVGASTLAASIVMAMHVWRSVQPKPISAASSPV